MCTMKYNITLFLSVHYTLDCSVLILTAELIELLWHTNNPSYAVCILGFSYLHYVYLRNTRTDMSGMLIRPAVSRPKLRPRSRPTVQPKF